jgi:Polyketide cyclase / dehydrase and lipid transport
MSHIHVQAEKVIPAPVEQVYNFLADYRDKHTQILTDNFLNYRVDEGGYGSGTVISYRFRAANREREYHMRISEPTPGRALKESDTGSSLTSTWTLSPAPNNSTLAQITTDWEGGKGVGGFFERTFAPMGLRRVYTEMLDKLAAVFSGVSTATK